MAKIIQNTPSLFSVDQAQNEPDVGALEKEFEKEIKFLKQDPPQVRPPAVTAILQSLRSKSSLAVEED